MVLQFILPLMTVPCAGSFLEIKHRQQVRQKIIYFILAAVLVFGVSFVARWFWFPSSGEYMTEFYLLGRGKSAENYPRQALRGEELTVTMGIMNREQEPHHYRIEIWAVSPSQGKRQLVSEVELGMIAPNITQEKSLVWSMPWVGANQKAQFLLFIDNHSQFDRQLELSINVIEPTN